MASPLEQDDVLYTNYIETQSGNKVSRESVLCGSQNIVLAGKTIIMSKCIIRGDLANVRVGKHCVMKSGSVIRPPWKQFPNKTPSFAFWPMNIGDFVTIEEGSVVSSAQIGSYVHIGKNCIIGRRCVIKDCVKIADGTVLPADSVIPPFCSVAGSPGKIVDELPECTRDIHRDLARNFYQHFVARPKK
eukprot:m.142212 g.142212  ORF g.142212 m.142212 type:complete len:188 (+) comp17134_c1_seq1:230-793(+)